MSESDWTSELAELFPRVRAGDADARSALFERLHDRLRRLVATVLVSFPGARRRHELDSVVNDLYISLVRAFDDGHVPADVTEFLRFAAFKLRRLLLDEADRARVRSQVGPLGPAGDSNGPGLEKGTDTWSPAKLLDWTEFHRAVETLSADERSVVELHLYLGLPQSEVAERLGVHPKAVSRTWLSATKKLTPYLPPER